MKFFKNRTSKRAATLALGASLLAAACGGSTTTTSGSATATSESGTESAATQLLTGTVGTVSGGQFDLGSLDGQDAVLWFWAPW